MSVLETLKKRHKEKDYLSVYINSEIIKQIDHYRGTVPRSWLVQVALNEFLDRELRKEALVEQSNRS